ncbi:MAG: hypothetical protein HPKKFMNG_00344 [Planctomycetes bacterium]|nr:hypothetical protein [Planctomycetota bacterium]
MDFTAGFPRFTFLLRLPNLTSRPDKPASMTHSVNRAGGSYRFSHGLYRMAALSLVSDPQRAKLAALLARESSDPEFEAARLRLLATPALDPVALSSGDHERLGREWLRAIDADIARFQNAPALQRCQALLERDDLPPFLRVELRLRQGALQERANQPGLARQAYEQAVAAADGQSQPRLQGLARARLGAALRRARALDEALLILGQAESLARTAGDDALLAESMLERGMVYDATGELTRAEECYTQTERVFRRLGRLDGVCRALGSLAVLHRNRGNVEAALQTLEEAQDMAEILGNPRFQAQIAGNRANILTDLGRPEGAKAAFHTSERFFRACGDKRGLATTQLNHGALLHELEDIDGALHLYEQALQKALELGDRWLENRALGNLAGIKLERGHAQEALELYQVALEGSRALKDIRNEIHLMGGVAAALSAQNRDLEGAQMCEEACRRAAEAGLVQEQADLAGLRAQLLQSAGRHTEAYAAALDALELVERTQSQTTLGYFHTLMVLITHERRSGNLKEAEFLARDAEEVAMRLGLSESRASDDLRQALKELREIRRLAARQS